MGQLKLKSRDFIEDVRAGLTEADLMQKHGLTERQLSAVFEKLLDAGKLNSGDLEHQPQFEGTMVVASTCVACGALKFVDSGACPQCGMINPGSATTATTKIGDPSSLVEGIKSLGRGLEDPTAVDSAVGDAVFHPEAKPWEERHRDELPTDSESWADPATEELSTSSKMWGEPHEEVLPSDEELWAGGPDIELSGLPEARTAHEPTSVQAEPAPRSDAAVSEEHAEASVGAPEANRPPKHDRSLQNDGDATEILTAFHDHPLPSGAGTGGKRIIRLAAAVAVLGAVAAVGFVFFDDIAGLLPGGGPPPPVQTVQVKRSTPQKRTVTVETPKQAVHPNPTQAVAAKGEPIGGSKEETQPAKLKEPPKAQPESVDKPTVASKTILPKPAEKLKEPQPKTGPPPPQPTAANQGKPETSPMDAPQEVKQVPEPSREPKPVAAIPPGKPTVDAAKGTDPASELILAIDNEEVKKARSLLSHGADPNATGRNGATALIHAVGTGNESLVRLLLERGALVTVKGPGGSLPLDAALRNRDARIARLILSRYQDKGVSQLLDASRKGDRSSLTLLLDAGANVNGTGEMGETPLMVAAGGGQIDTVKFLLEKGADPRVTDKKGVNALGWARSPVSLAAVPLRVQRDVVQVLKSYTGR